MGLTEQVVCGPRGPLDGVDHKRKAPPDMLTCRSVQACLSREVPTDHEAPGPTQRWLQVSRSVDLCSRSFGGRRPEAKAETGEVRSYPHSGLRALQDVERT